MLIKFRPGPSAKASASFGSFDGIKRTCTGFEKKNGKLRCAKYKKGRGHPVCDSRLVDGGRSPGLVRKGKCQRHKRAHKSHSKKRGRKR